MECFRLPSRRLLPAVAGIALLLLAVQFSDPASAVLLSDSGGDVVHVGAATSSSGTAESPVKSDNPKMFSLLWRAERDWNLGGQAEL